MGDGQGPIYIYILGPVHPPRLKQDPPPAHMLVRLHPKYYTYTVKPHYIPNNSHALYKYNNRTLSGSPKCEYSRRVASTLVKERLIAGFTCDIAGRCVPAQVSAATPNR